MQDAHGSGAATAVEAIRWVGDGATGHLLLLDQRRLPVEECWVTCRSVPEVSEAIRSMVVRGAPAIGVAAAYGLVLAGQEARGRLVDPSAMRPSVERLAASRPTAVNLRWALDRMVARAGHEPGGIGVEALLAEAEAIRREDVEANRRIGALGAPLLPAGGRVLTICNTGALATAGHGTALGILRTAWAQDRITGVVACETRPWLQGARLTMWELQREGIACWLATDGMAGHLMQRGEVTAVVAGADRIAANGDTANKIGTYGLAVLARHHGLPFMIAAPWSTVDAAAPDGGAIPIEERGAEEVLTLGGVRIAPAGARALNPAFDVTPGSLIDAIVTERGVVRPPYASSLPELGAAGE